MRVARVIAAVALLLAGSGLAAAAALQAWSGGWFATPEYRFATPAAALKTDEIEVGMDEAHADDPSPDIGEAAKVAIDVRPADPAVPMFVGIGPKAKVEEYLRGGSYDEFVSARLSPFHATFRRVNGTPRLASPTGQGFWVASSAGTGPRHLTWDKTSGAWSVVVMRLDGTPGVDVRASIGLRFGFLAPVAAGTLLAGAVAVAFILRARRRDVEVSS
ncbi:hypothetical protein J4573_01390 [Actinomadura barringtoniae]|uniref:DUF3153 domain-containing protein n=1 Tax=Actinomadura barringtoniae TaxID=1427535 RepID=A0A939T7C5_9ACTN|nr:hypothetical protein [Actinomadura barringtoniae]MBO2445735.1 hypothetical protein [Actinomadura barringtoniae]